MVLVRLSSQESTHVEFAVKGLAQTLSNVPHAMHGFIKNAVVSQAN